MNTPKTFEEYSQSIRSKVFEANLIKESDPERYKQLIKEAEDELDEMEDVFGLFKK